MGFFINATMTLTRSNGTIVQQHLPVTLDPVNLPWNMEVGGTIAVDIFDCETVGWATPVPLRSDYFVDEKTGARYSMFTTVFTGINSLQFQVSKPSGGTP